MARTQTNVLCLLTLCIMAVYAANGCAGKSTNSLGPGDDSTNSSSGGFDTQSSSGGASGGGGPGGSSGFAPPGSGVGDAGLDASGLLAAQCAAWGGLYCLVPTGCTTSLSGYVYDPAGRVPLPNAVVFVPGDAKGGLSTITSGTQSCNTCDAAIGDYVAAGTTDITGHFTLKGVPATTNVPFVVQVGKWRREQFLTSVTACQDNPVPAAQSRLPQTRKEGSMPQMAISTGEEDNLGCFLHTIGIADSEFSAPHSGGALNVYRGATAGGGPSSPYGPVAPGLSTGTAGDCTTSNCPLWSTKPDLEYYDIVLLACEGAENLTSKPATAIQAMHDWLNEGGKVFATHFHYVWFKDGPADFAGTANWLGNSVGGATGNYAIDTSFTSGMLFDQWLGTPMVGALTGGALPMTGVADSVSTVNPGTYRWVYDSSTNHTKYMSFLTPIGGIKAAGSETATYCGKAVFSDLHAGGVPTMSYGPMMPGGATADLPAACDGMTAPPTQQEKALEYLFFDLSSCVSDPSKPPPPPPPSSSPPK